MVKKKDQRLVSSWRNKRHILTPYRYIYIYKKNILGSSTFENLVVLGRGSQADDKYHLNLNK